jgi:hypothetical protein
VHEVDRRQPPHRSADAEHVPRVVEERGRRRQDHRSQAVEIVVVQRALDIGTRVTRGERGHVEPLGRE